MKSHPAEARAHGLSSTQLDEWLHADEGSPWKRAVGGGLGYDDGGAVDPNTGSAGVGGLMPSAATANPLVQGVQQRYASLPTEKLQELAGVMGGTPQGQIIRATLQKRLTQPNAMQPQQAAQPGAASALPQTIQTAQAQARGGVTRRDIGGGVSLSEADPSWTRQQQRGELQGGSGVLAGGTLGRQDSIRTTALGGAYVLPADVVSALGEGNSLAGARVLDEILSSGPYGTPMPRAGRGMGAPRPPRPATESDAKGGPVHDGGIVPVALSDGEYVVQPRHVMAIGGGDLKRGHKALDAFVKHIRAKHIETLKKLPGPVKSS